jgi:hypothetical protein
VSRRYLLFGLTGCVIAAGAAWVFLRPRPTEAPPLDEALRRAHGVARVEVALTCDKPARRIVHILDYRLVPRDLFGSQGYAAHMARVEAVQEEQIALLRWLRTRQGVTEVYVEGLTEENLPEFVDRAFAVDEMGNGEIPDLLGQLADARAERNGKTAAIEQALAKATAEHEERLLALGAAGRLYMIGKLHVLPLEDAAIYEKAKPRLVGGKVQVHPRAAKVRADAMVRNVLRGDGELAVLVLGAGHDLTESIEEQDPRCEYIRVTTGKLAELFGEMR